MFNIIGRRKHIQFSFLRKSVSHFPLDVAVKLSSIKHSLHKVMYSCNRAILRADLLLAIQIEVKLLASQQGIRVCALEYNKGGICKLTLILSD